MCVRGATALAGCLFEIAVGRCMGPYFLPSVRFLGPCAGKRQSAVWAGPPTGWTDAPSDRRRARSLRCCCSMTRAFRGPAMVDRQPCMCACVFFFCLFAPQTMEGRCGGPNSGNGDAINCRCRGGGGFLGGEDVANHGTIADVGADEKRGKGIGPLGATGGGP